MAQFKRFNSSENPNRSDTTAAYPNGVLTWDDVNGLRLHDGTTAGGNAIGGGAGGPVFQLTSSTSVAKLTSDGVLTVPGAITSVDGQSVLMFASSGTAAILSNYIGFNQIFVQDDGAYIQTSANNMGSTFATWTFGTDGSTTFPNDTILGTGSDPNVYIQTLANGSTSTWTFGTDSQLTLPKGGIISETTSTVEIAPPSANPGQSLMIRPTASFNLSASGYIVPGENLIITLTNTNNAAVDNTYINYTITGATAHQLGLASLTGHFPYLSPAATNPQSASIVLPIPLSSSATTFTLTTDSDQPAGSANITITVTNNNIVNNEVSHVHLVAGDPTTVDLYLGDDDQYVKIERDHGNVVIGTTNFYGSPSNVITTWTFGIDGGLSLPTGNIRAESDIKIQLGVPISLGLGTGIGGWDDNGGTNLPTTGGTGSGLTVDVVGDVSGYPSSITIHTPGSGYTDGDMVTVSNGGSYYTIFVTIRTTDWQLSSNGTLILPSGGDIVRDGVTVLGGGGSSGPSWQLTSSTAVVSLASNGTLTLPNSNATISFANGTSGEMRIWYDNDITIYRNGQDGYAVKSGEVDVFAGNTKITKTTVDGVELKQGSLTFPDSTIQTTAWTPANVTQDVTFAGNVTFANTATYTQSTNTVYTDSLIEIHAPTGGVNGSWAVNDGNDIGFRFHYYDGADKNAALFMDNGTWRLKWAVNGTETNGQFNHSGLGDIEAANFYGNFIGSATTATSLSNSGTNFRAVSPPSVLTGAAGDRTGDVAFDASYVYYCTTTYGGIDYVSVTTAGQTATYAFIAKSGQSRSGITANEPQPQAGWTITIPGSGTFTITSVSDAGNIFGNASWQVNWSGSSVSTTGGTQVTVTNPGVGNTWVRTPWNAITGINTSSFVVNDFTAVGTTTVGIFKATQVAETFSTLNLTNASTATFNCSGGNVFNVNMTGMAQNWTPWLTNLNVSSGTVATVSIVVNQTSTAFIPTSVVIPGATNTSFTWQGGSTPTGSANKKDVIAYNIYSTLTNYYTVLAQLVSF